MYYVTIITTDGETLNAEHEKCPELSLLKQAVGGYTETVPYWDWWEGRECVAFYNEEGKLDGLPYNALATSLWHTYLSPIRINDTLHGNVIIVSVDTPEEMAEL
jgi:hypothetical protein